MANQEHLDILMQGVKIWNQWRKEHADIQLDLSHANLRRASLNDVDLSQVNLRNTNMSGANLLGSDLRGANLNNADLSNVDLWDTDLSGVNLSHANLSNAHFGKAYLSKADLSIARLNGTDFSGAFLWEANLRGAILSGAYLSGAYAESTIFAEVDLSRVKGLETVRHRGPSTIDTIYLSKGLIPKVFLQGAGVPDSFITYMRSLVVTPIDYYTCFISYSSKDDTFVEQLHKDLQSNGVRCWFAPEDMKIGDKIRPRINESIRTYDKLLLVLSEHSVNSQWVEQEVETALAKEREGRPLVLFPIRLDETVMQMTSGWPALIHNTRHIGDFTRWKQHDDYQQAFERLLRDLKAEA